MTLSPLPMLILGASGAVVSGAVTGSDSTDVLSAASVAMALTVSPFVSGGSSVTSYSPVSASAIAVPITLSSASKISTRLPDSAVPVTVVPSKVSMLGASGAVVSIGETISLLMLSLLPPKAAAATPAPAKPISHGSAPTP